MGEEPAETDVEAKTEIELEPELPLTGGNDIILLALAAVLAGSGLALRRKRK